MDRVFLDIASWMIYLNSCISTVLWNKPCLLNHCFVQFLCTHLLQDVHFFKKILTFQVPFEEVKSKYYICWFASVKLMVSDKSFIGFFL